MNTFIRILTKSGLLKDDLDYHLVRASMVLVFVLFGYQKWFASEAQTLIPFISNGPLTFWMYPVFGLRGASYFLGASEWLTAALLIWGFWNPRAGILGATVSVYLLQQDVVRASLAAVVRRDVGDSRAILHAVDTAGPAGFHAR